MCGERKLSRSATSRHLPIFFKYVDATLVITSTTRCSFE